MIHPDPTTTSPTSRSGAARQSARMSTEAFESVLDAARVGAEWAFSVLYREHNHLLLRYFAARAPREADDLAAEVWLAAARRLGTFEGDATAFRSWLFTIAHHRLVQHWRDTGRRPPGDSYDAAPEQPVGEPGGGDPAEAVGSVMSAQDAVRRIAAVLSPEQAEVVLLRILGGLDVDQVAVAVGKRPGAVRVLQHRALKKLATSEIFLEGVTP